MRKATVCVPIAALYAVATSDSVLQDEILYGMEVSVLEEVKENGMCSVVSFYEYAGFVSSLTLCDGGYPANRVVSAPFAHLACRCCVCQRGVFYFVWEKRRTGGRRFSRSEVPLFYIQRHHGSQNG